MSASISTPMPGGPGNWWDKLVVSLELADLTDETTRDRLDSAAAKAHNQGLHTAAAWQYARALPMLTAAIEIWEKLDHVAGTVLARNTRANALRKVGDAAAAHDDYGVALDLAQAHDLTSGAITAQAGLGALFTITGEYDQAEEWLAQAHATAETAGDGWGLGYTGRLTGQLAEARKDWDRALSAYGKAVERWRTLAAPVEEIEAQAGMARVLLAQGQAVGAYSLIEGVLLHLGDHGPARLDEPLRLYFTIYRVLHAMQQPDSAAEMLRTAYQMMHRHAEGLSDERRTLFFEAVPLHVEIDTAWTAQQATD